MNFIMQMSLGFSAAAIFIGAILIISPNGTMNKSVKYVYGLIFLCIAVSLFTVFPKNKTKQTNSFASNETSAKISGMTQSQIEYICLAALQDNGIFAEEISVFGDIDEDFNISINKITVKCNRSTDINKVKKTITETVQTHEVEVIYE